MINSIKKYKGLLFTFLLLFPLWGTGGLSQTYPVQVNVHALAPYSNQLSDYYTTSREKLVVSLLNRDQNRPTLDVELQMTISSSSGLKLQNRLGVYYPTISLTQGVMTRLTQDDLAPYLQAQNINRQGYMNQGKLPDGMVEFTFQAIEKYTRKAVSLPATARVWLTTQKPPLLSLPSNGEMTGFSEPMNLRFQWTPQHKNISQVEYEFELRELPDNDASAQSAFLYSPVIHQERLLYTSLMYTPMMPLLDPDKTYGWRVRAIAKDGADEINLFENGGFSEIWFFKTQTNCLSPMNCAATVRDNSIELTWAANGQSTDYAVQYRPKTSVSGEWKTITAGTPKATLKSLQYATAYEYRVGVICGDSKQPVYTAVYEAATGERDLSNCGLEYKADVSNRELLPELRIGDVVRVGGGFPLTVTRVSGGNGVFTGEGVMPLRWVLNAEFAVEFVNLLVNTDYEQIGGRASIMYNTKKAMVGDLDAFTEGGVVENTRNGIVMPELTLDFVIPENPVFEYNPQTNELMVFSTDGGEPQAVQMPKNDGKTVFPVTVKDKEGNLYKVENLPPPSSEGGGAESPSIADSNQPLTATYLGKQGEVLPELDNNNVAYNTAIVSFEKGGGNYAFDTWQDYYQSVSIIDSKKVYEHLNGGNKKPYHVPWKLLPAGESDVVKAKIELIDKSFNPEKVIFSTPQGVTFKSAYDSKNKTYTLSLAAGQDNDVQEIYALNKLSNENYQTLGKLNVITYKKQSPKLVIVNINNYRIDEQSLKAELDDIYLPVGVDWQVSSDAFSYEGDKDNFLNTESSLLQSYTEPMKKLQAAYAAEGGIDKNTCYIFVLNYSGTEKNRNTAGFMPRGKQFGYIFLSNLKVSEVNNAVAHELGHGLWKLRHTFDESYGKTAQATQGTTNNLMDYNRGTALAKWQWDMMSAPAIFDGVLDSDEEGMKLTDYCNAQKPAKAGTKEAEKAITKGVTNFTGYNTIELDCEKVWYYHTGTTDAFGKVTNTGWHEEDDYPNVIKNVIKGLLILNSDDIFISYRETDIFQIQSLKADYIYACQTFLSKENINDAAIEAILNNKQYINKAYNELQKEISHIHFMRSGAIQSISPEFELMTLGLGAVIKNITVKLVDKAAIKGMSREAFTLAVRNALGKGSVKVIFKNVDEFLAKVPASFREQVKKAFVDGTATIKYADKDMILYRHISKDGPEISYWFSRTIESPANAKKLFALPKDNTAEMIVKVRVKEGTPYIEGKVASQVNNTKYFDSDAIGGGNQLYFLQEDLSNIEKIEKFTNSLK